MCIRDRCGNDESPYNHCPLVQRDEHYNAPVPEHGGFVRFLQLQWQHYRLNLTAGSNSSRAARQG